MQRSILLVVTLVCSVSLAPAQRPDATATPRITSAPKTEVLPTPPLKRFVIGLPPADKINRNGLALSPDGKTLVYIGNRDGVLQLFRRSMDQLEAVPIPGTEGARVPFFSPDGQWVGFFTEDKLKKVALAGGPAVTLCEISRGRWGASWGLDDTVAFSFSGPGLLRVPAVGGAPQPLIKVAVGQGESHRWPDILPSGKAVLFTVFPGTLEEARIAVADLETGQHRILLKGTQPRYVRTGHIVFARPGSLWAVQFDADRLELTGAPLLENKVDPAWRLTQLPMMDRWFICLSPPPR